MSKLAHAAEHHRNAGFVGGRDHVLIVEQATRAV
jgi:hypothetical protein